MSCASASSRTTRRSTVSQQPGRMTFVQEPQRSLVAGKQALHQDGFFGRRGTFGGGGSKRKGLMPAARWVMAARGGP